MYKISGTKAFDLDTTDPNKPIVKTNGDEAKQFWTDNKTWFIAPTVMNGLSLALLGLFYVTGQI
jgi:hypothetical protein